MTDLTAEEIEDVRQRLKSQLDDLLACNALWYTKLTRSVLDAAIEQANGHTNVIVGQPESQGLELVEDAHRCLLRDLIATGMLRRLALLWTSMEWRPGEPSALLH
jgi:hypothetical protein